MIKAIVSKYIIFIPILFIFFYQLGNDFVTTDDTHFKNWSYVYMQELENENFDKLYVTVQPGVVTIYTNIIGFKSFYFLKDRLGYFTSLNDRQIDLVLHTFYKAPKVILVITILILIFIQLEKLFSAKVAKIFMILFTLEPFVIGNVRSIQTDIIPSLLIFLSCLLYMRFRNQKSKSVLITAFIIAISTIEKASSTIILPIMFMTLFIDSKNFKIFLKDLFLFIAVYITTLILFFPAFWGNFKFTFWRLFIGSYIQGVVGLDAENFTYAKTPHVYSNLYYLRFFYNKLSDIFLITLLISVVVYIRDKSYLKISKGYFVLYFTPFLFFIVHQLATKKGERFMLYVVPFLFLFISINLLKLVKSNIILNILILSFFTYRFMVFYSIFPDFLVYKNPLSLDNSYSNYYIGWGVGYKKLANYFTNTYGRNKDIYTGYHENLRLFYEGNVNNYSEFSCEKSNVYIIKASKLDNLPCENLSLVGEYSPYKNVIFYIYKN